jgi:exosortase A
MWGYQETIFYLASIWTRWSDGSYGHGFLLLVLSSCLVYRQRKTLATIAPRPGPGALLAIFVSSMIWLAATLASVQVVQYVAVLLLVISVVWVISGRQAMKHLLLPILFIGFAIPVWSPLSPVLQEITIAIAYFVIRVLEVPALREGFIIVLPAGQLLVEEACSGLNYLLAALTLGVFHAVQAYQSNLSRLLVVLIAVGVALLTNLLRVVVIIYLAYSTDMQHPFVDDHLALGWYLFGAFVLILLLIEHFMLRGNVQLTTAPAVKSRNVSRAEAGSVHAQHLALLFVACVATLSGPTINWWVTGQSADSDDINLVLPAGVGGWSGPYESRDGWEPVYYGAVTQMGAYRKYGEVVFLFSAIYGNQKQGSELVSDLNSISGDRSMQLRKSPERNVSTGRHKAIELELISAEGRRRLVWYWYRVAGRDTQSDYMAKLLQILGAISGRTEAAVIVISTEIQDSTDAARNKLEDFLAQMSRSLGPIAYGRGLQREIAGK